MFKGLIAKFMAKTLVMKIVITTSTIVVIGGATAGAIIIPKEVEKYRQEQAEIERQAEIQRENEEDLANMDLVLNSNKDLISLPLNGVTQGFTIERYEWETYIGKEDKKEELHQALIDLFIESYKGGTLTVEEDIDLYKRGDYPVTFTLTSEKGNTKTETATITVWNYAKVNVYVDKENITVTKGTSVDIMEGVTFDSNLPEEEQGEIKAEGTVDTNTVGTYTITYTYVPQDEHEGVISQRKRTYNVIEKSNVKLNEAYFTYDYQAGMKVEYVQAKLVFTSESTFTYTAYDNYNVSQDAPLEEREGNVWKGTYTIEDNKVTLENESFGIKYFIVDNDNMTFTFNMDHYNTEDDLNV